MIKLIIVDDEPIRRQGLTMLPWEEEGFAVAGVADNGTEALELIRGVMPDLLLADIRMPGMDGITLLEEARNVHPRMKAIFITAYHQFDYALKAIQLGAAGFILKPTDPDDIMAECRKAKRQIDEEWNREKHTDGMRDQLKEYRLMLQAKVTEGGPDGEGGVVHDMLRELEERYMEDLTIVSFSQRYHFHPDYLSRLFKRTTGEHFVNVLTRIRMQKAIELLADASTKVYEISERVGFRDARYFGQQFKKRYGVTPNEFRRRLNSDPGAGGLEEQR